MSIKLERPNLLKDALYNASASSGASKDYSKGLIVGVVSTIMAMEAVSFEEACRIVRDNLPRRVAAYRIPEAFRGELIEKIPG